MPGCQSVLIVDGDSGNRDRWRAAFEEALFRVCTTNNRAAALTRLGDAAGIDLLVVGAIGAVTSRKFSLEAFELRGSLRMIIIASMANPVGIHEQLAILLEPVSDADLIGTARTLLSQPPASTAWAGDGRN